MSIDRAHEILPCPVCAAPLRRWRDMGVEGDGCDVCGGLWLGAPALRGLANDPPDVLDELETEFTPGLAPPVGGSHACPTDGTPLKPHHLGYAEEILLDRCPACGGIWFDDGELAALAERLAVAAGAPAGPVAPEHRAAAVAGVVRRIYCPACGDPNPEISERCFRCKALLHGPPADGVGVVQSVHRFHGLGALTRFGVLFAATVAAIVWHRYLPHDHRLYWFEGLVLAGLVAGGLLGGGRYVAVTTLGLVLKSWWHKRFLPWQAIRSITVLELGSRAAWAPLAWLLLWHPWWQARRALLLLRQGAYDEDLAVSGARVLLLAFTTRGLFAFGPELDGHVELVEAVRRHL
ncbi:MAG: zf-TFIIB domain-containing protein [Armatimonadetes bacterium]|nr:zf-TFIIB domain-containing protein [Armatimonadota bacterium]